MLEIKNVSKKFKNNEVLKDININFEEHKVTGILGNNGVGKTTLLKIIFQELRPDQGEITFKNNKITFDDYLKLHFFTENNELPKTLTVKEYCDYFLSLKFIKTPSEEEIEKLKWIFDFSKFKKSKIEKLSAGEKKMYSLFLLFLIDAEVYFFDEPTANLDVENKNIITTAMKYLKSENKTIIIITHLIEEVADILDKIVIFKQGKVVFDGKTKNIKKTYAQAIEQVPEDEIMRKLKNAKK